MFLFWSFFPRYNKCSPFFWLCKCVEILLFGAILKGQNAKKNKKKTKKKTKRKAGDEQNLSPNISTVRALEKIIETDLRSYSAGLPFSFF